MSVELIFDRDNVYIYPFYIADLAITKDIKKITGTRIKTIVTVIENDHVYDYHDPISSRLLAKNIFRLILKNKNFFKKTVSNIYIYSNELIKFCNSVDRKKLNNLRDDELLKIYFEYIKKLKKLRCWGWIPVMIDALEPPELTSYLLKNFEEHLKKIGEKKNISKYYSILSSSEKKSEVQQEEISRLNLLQRIIEIKKTKKKVAKISKINFQSPRINNLLNEHIKSYGWLTYAYSGPVMQKDYLVNVLKDNLLQGDPADQKKKIFDYYKDLKKQKAFLSKKLGLTPKLKYLFYISSVSMFIKDYRKGIYQKSYVVMDKVLAEIARRLNFSLKGVKYLVFGELKEALGGNKKNYFKTILKERMKKSCCIFKNGEVKIYQGEQAEKLISKFIQKKNVDLNRNKIKRDKCLKGTIAYNGKVKGIVKIVLQNKDINKVNKGDILVSSATNPDLILAMKRAGAFVTDTGGIVSHAAIIAREMKKPCVVGTGVASKFLKDGDFVEVDADLGIVKLIKRNGN